VKAVRGCGKSAADVRCTGYMPDSQESKETWTTSIRLAPCDDGGSRAVALELQPTLRPMAGGRVERWEVTKVELVGPVKTGQ
jgi:hypothetical protein